VAVGGIAISGRWPDLTMILDMPAERSIARVQRAKDRIEQRPPEYHQRVRQGFLSQASTHPERYRVINADRSVEQVQADMRSAVSGLLEKLH
jgi:dTMP kinase